MVKEPGPGLPKIRNRQIWSVSSTLGTTAGKTRLLGMQKKLEHARKTPAADRLFPPPQRCFGVAHNELVQSNLDAGGQALAPPRKASDPMAQGMRALHLLFRWVGHLVRLCQRGGLLVPRTRTVDELSCNCDFRLPAALGAQSAHPDGC